jgi:hypothetical protein
MYAARKGMMAPPSEAILFEEDWESGTGQWSPFGSRFSIVTDNDFGVGSKVLRVRNSPNQQIETDPSFSGKPTKIEFFFKVITRGFDDVCITNFTAGATSLVSFIFSRQSSTDAARRVMFSATSGLDFMLTVQLGDVYKAEIFMDWTTGKTFCQIFLGGTLVDTSIELSFNNAIGDMTIMRINNQQGDSNGDGEYGDILITE